MDVHNVRRVTFEQLLEPVLVAFSYVKAAASARLDRILIASQRTDDDGTGRSQNPPDFSQQLFELIEVLDIIEAQQKVDGGIGQGNLGPGASHLLEVSIDFK